MRCQPATDILVLTALPDLSTLHPAARVEQEYFAAKRNKTFDKQFPGD